MDFVISTNSLCVFLHSVAQLATKIDFTVTAL